MFDPSINVDSPPQRVNFEELFGRKAPVQVDLGCGDGLFLSQMAALQPEKNFLGIERLARRVAKTAKKASRLANMRVLRVDTSHAVNLLLPPHSIEAIYLLFPDPWPKRRHHRRRIVTVTLLESIHRALEPNGTLRIATDHADYFAEIKRIATQWVGCLKLDRIDPSSLAGSEMTVFDETGPFPQTRFEQRFRAAGLPIYRLSLRKISPVT